MIAFGPVPSRRLGRSLGFNNIPPKICSYACVYCQLGRTLTMRGDRQSFRAFNWVGFRYVKLRFRKCFEETKVHAFVAVNSTFPFVERGSFTSDNATLNRIYEISRYTIRLCSNEFLTDTPWREQGQWLGDVSAVTLGGIYACFGELSIA